MSEKTEIQLIREEMGLSRQRFGEMVIKRTPLMVKLYEKKTSKVPDHILFKARRWLAFYREEMSKD